MNILKDIKYVKIFFVFILIFFFFINKYTISNKNLFYLSKRIIPNKNRIGVVNLPHGQNCGNILVKFAMFKKLEEFGFNATIISPNHKIEKIDTDISFLKRTIKSHLLIVNDSFNELKENDYDYLMVNSDQTWNFYKYAFFYNVALLKFAENWNVNKFIYATSMADYRWYYKKKDEILFKKLLKNFTGISFREKGTVKLVENHLGLKSVFVLDPTLLIDQQYYLDEIKNFKSNFTSNEKFLFIYLLQKNYFIEKIIEKASEKFNLKINKLQLEKKDYIESFIYGISQCQALITDSFHGTIFSIIFNKPFITFSFEGRGKARMDHLKELLGLKNRILDPSEYSSLNISLLLEPLNINLNILKKMKNFSINYLKKNLGLLD